MECRLDNGLKGFIDPSRRSTVADASLLYAHIARRLDRDMFRRLEVCGDINHDGAINIQDAEALMLYVTGTI